ncbi:hypothetical protein EBR21_11745 [bacterium]|nr:hypothetical protein [bacterium]
MDVEGVVSQRQVDSSSRASLRRGNPKYLSHQLGIPIQEVLNAIEFAQLEPSEGEGGDIEYEFQSVMKAYLEQSRLRETNNSAAMQAIVRECIDGCQESLRQMIREENRVAYQIKDMTESRFLEVLGQVSLSLGRVEAFVMQAARLLSQIDMRLARNESAVENLKKIAPVPTAEQSRAIETSQGTEVGKKVPVRAMTNSEHWREFEAQMTRIFSVGERMSESAISDWLSTSKAVLNLGSLELRLNGEHLMEGLRPALMDSSFSALHLSLPAEENVLPAFENFQEWVRVEREKGHSAILLYLVLILNRGPQISWSGFVTTFINEA